ncbi:PLP-dependent aminotransferase family protein [Fodinicola acaciae]|uniref:MocR-like pyridoxine biosynthesis transcription factor PdxR n=1 Tax=Fodinicola acaciae TaxID=2681555 RepID=UPI0013D5662B|nr:PLP-dependent aminotransferase family protein [Fodinicola acaciae]
MPIEWSGLSPELLLSMDRTSAVPLRSQLEDALRAAIRCGRLQVGERLPSSRELARALGVSRGLVQECFGQLQAEGYLSTRVGSATRVAAGACDVPAPAAPAPPPARLRADFRHGVPDLASFPRADWLWTQKEISRDAANETFDYGDPQGNLEFRGVLAAYLRRVRQIVASPECIVVCSGFAQGLTVVLTALMAKGVRRVAFEDPGYEEAGIAHRQRLHGFEAVRVPVDEQGIDVDALAASGADAVVITPAHQWPTGVVLAPERRHALLEWTKRTGGFIVEDDYDAEFRYDRDPVGALQGLAPDCVIALGTASKSLAPAIRIGWAVCPPSLASLVAETKHESDRGTPVFEQLAMAKLMESGRFHRHLRRMRSVYAARRAALVEALAEHAPSIEITGLAAGLHAVAHLPAGVDETSVIAAARERSVGLYGMAECRSDHAVLPGQLLLGFGNIGERTIREGIATIADLF